jgi:hypothetical protein
MLSPADRREILMLKGLVSEAPAEDQAKIAAARAELMAVATKYGDFGKIALVFVTTEVLDE